MVPEAKLEDAGAGLVPASGGWFVMNARDGRWIERPGRGYNIPLTGWTEHEAETYFPQLGMAIIVTEPGKPTDMYHWEADAEAFLVLSGEAILLVEGQERPLKQWDFVHCPPGTQHTFVGAGRGPCHILAVGAREHQTGDWGAYTVDEAAARYNASVEQETSGSEAYARFEPSTPTRFRDGFLPD